jgi:hypothetical protein
MRLFLPGLLLFVLPAFPLIAQEAPAELDPVEWIGMTLRDMLHRYGQPQSVYAVRGREEWQDDVVFVYDHGDFYVFKDRVWQVGLKSAYQIKAGDSRAAALLALGEKAENRESYLLSPLPGGSWPLALRCNFDETGKVSIIFIYRSDL